MTTELDPITVHTNERLFIEFAPETTGISKVITSGGKKGFYVAPLNELEWLSNMTGENGPRVEPPEGALSSE